MTRSASTPRVRLTLCYFLALLAAAAFCAPRAGSAAWLATTQIAALLLIALACLGRIWCSVFIAGRKDAAIVIDGPYALVRHPLYVLSFVGGIGLSLATASLSLIALTAIVLAVLFGRAARREELWLGAHHREAWALYAATTRRWRPDFAKWSLPPSTPVNPAVLWKAFVDAGAFFLLYALMLAAIALREAGVLPTLAVLP
ncbi:MAG TPA: isoprenylcysteine carboxylmethyltransferase family protein [Steroidobacteraceae bacterium]|nr:isoprenylcysteine carboxylmethyltransferase family protein [Steroidobacteraceae bacterium]HQW07640.1 isoprenylcysteine carboxylmethyltransferase family protein [Steroidobacteraceae bacterium]HQX46897.1 isoprenylcysteine carboxylmethyltransferase family protein [Steroidobacteraceae bacterium]HQX78931.1 isoprenylcysteine carboxylmethyltransferase family protein [Steroidobacteraceae bacterium]HQZ80811.1 isoprenylcysteine carboxylmethyltransferase family protein [Steroidobacteraceae bacterium]